MTIWNFTQEKFLSLDKIKDMNLFEYTQKFPNEQSCKEYLKDIRLKEGIICKKCASQDHYWKKDKEVFQCKKCSFRTSLKSGTIFENSNLTLDTWFKAIHLISSTKKTFSALEIQKQLGYPSYEPVWQMLHKIRWAMGKRDDKYHLAEYLEIDEGFFKVVDKEFNKENIQKGQKRGRGAISQAKVLVLIESALVENSPEKYKHKPHRKCGYLKMIVMDDLKANSINQAIEPIVEKDTFAITDKYKGYVKLKGILKHKEINTSGLKEIHTVFPWVHSAIGNAKKVLSGLHHSIGKEYLQSYLNEFCYKYNRRYFPDLFERLMIACITV
jgi:hypothetical protein